MKFSNNRTRRRKSIFQLCLIGGFSFLGNTLYAAPIDWLNPADGTFSDGAAWDGGVAPGATDDAIFNTGSGSYQVDFSVDTSTSTAFVRDENVSWDLQNNTYTMSSVDGLQVRGDGDNTASLIVSNGSLITTDIRLGDPPEEEVDPPTSEVFRGTMTIDNADVQASGTVTLGGDPGYAGAGELNIINGGSLIAADIVSNPDGSRIIVVDGPTSTLNAQTFTMFGSPGGGGISLSNGASATIGKYETESDSVTETTVASGSALNINELVIDGAGSGVNEISALATGSITTGSIEVTQVGRMFGEVSGPGSSWVNNGDLNFLGKGYLRVTDQGQFTNTGTAVITTSDISGPEVSVSGSGSKWTNGGDVTITGTSVSRAARITASNGGEIDAAGQTITANDFGEVIVDGGTIKASQIVLSGGSLLGTGTIVGNVVNGSGGFVGTVSPGSSPGILNIDGDYTQSVDGALIMELAGLTPGSGYDVLAITGTANLAGTLELIIEEGFVAEFGDSFDLLTADSIVGTFDTLLLPELAGSLYWQTQTIDLLNGSVAYQASVVPIPPAATLFGSALAVLGWARRRSVSAA